MGRWPKTPRLWVLCVGFVLLAVHGAIGPISNFVQQVSKPSNVHPWARRTLLSATPGPPPNDMDVKLELSSMLAPSTLPPLEPPSTDKSPALLPTKEKGPTPAYPPKSQHEYAHTQIMVPEGAVPHPPVIMPPKSEVLPPSTPAVIPLMQPSAPPEHVITKRGPAIISPSIPTLPVWKDHDPSPSYTVPPLSHARMGVPEAGVHEQATGSNSPVPVPHTQGQAVPPKSIAFPITHGHGYGTPTAAPPKELSNHLTPADYPFPEGPAVSPTSITSPAKPGNKYSMPVVAPSTDSSSNLSPVNYSHPKGPAISPTSMTSSPNHENRYGMPVAAPPPESSSHLSPINYSHPKGPAVSPTSIASPAKRGNRYDMPAAAPSTESSSNLSPVNHPLAKVSTISPTSIASPGTPQNGHGMLVAAPPKEFSRHLSPVNYSHPKSPAVLPAPSTPPANYGRYGMPVPAPMKDISSPLSPKNFSHTKGSSPVISPAPRGGDRPSDVVHSPFSSPPQRPVQRILNSPAPAPVVSFHQPTARERTGSLASAPSPQSHNRASSHPPALLPKPNREHHAPPPYIQGPVQSPALSPSASASGKLRAPELQPFHSLPPLPPRHSSPINYSDPKRPAVSPAPATPPANYGRYGTPVPASPKDVSSPLSPKNYSHTKGSLPVISPAPHEFDRPSYSVHSPFTSHPQPPIQRIFHSPAPAPVASFRQKTGRQRTGSPASAPSPKSHDPGPSHPPAVLPKHSREHHAPPPYVQAPSHPPAVFPKHSREHHASPPYVQAPSHPPAVLPKHSQERHAPPPYDRAPSHPPAVVPRHSREHHAPPPYVQAPSHPPAVFPKHSQEHHASPPYVQAPSYPPAVLPKHSRERHAPPPYVRAPSHPPSVLPKHSREHHTPPPYVQGPSVSQSPFHSADNEGPAQSPVLSPASASSKPRASQLQPFRSLPPPPPNLDCTTPLTCSEPLTNSLPGSPCACVMPIRVGLRLSIALYAFFPLVSDLAQEIASGVLMKQSQVRIMGANATADEYDKTIVLIDLVPRDKFNYTTAFSVYEKFWGKQVAINASSFGDYDVLYVYYPGLPPSPPMAPGNIDNGGYGNDNNSRTVHPLAADVRKQKEKHNGTVIAIIVISAVVALVLCVGAVWVFLLKHRELSHLPTIIPQMSLPPFSKASGGVPTIPGSRPSSASASFNSSIATCAGSAKKFSLAEMERATNKFNDSRIIGEGGFGCVYEGTLEDGRRAAIKVLKRDDQQGSRGFLAEVEMLSRLHHRNLVKLIGICTEEHIRCLVYELVPNGSVESHLYGAEKQSAPLDWNARLKIALGAARGLAYLHEDSSPRVIHRDFKASNILLEDDLTPKVSDFGLARAALDEGNEHISTHVMGTFGYVAPEYAMTGHLLVKSDVYSYGVVLLELLTGRKPVDMLRPPGQENLVTWARPLLTSKDGLETIIDPSLGTIPFDSVAKVAAIASMCVQPEVNQRPFMGEVVQALKLVYNEGNERRESGSFSQEEISTPETEIRVNTGLDLELDRVISASDIFNTSARFTRDVSGSFQRFSRSGPLRTSRIRQFWHRARDLSSGSASEHGKFGTSLENGD